MDATAVADDVLLLTNLNDDSLVHIFKSGHDVSAIAALASCNKQLSQLSHADFLWEHCFRQTWPCATPGTPPSSWREHFRMRCEHVPSWRHYLVRMDEVEHIMGCLACSDGSSTSQRDGLCDRLAVLLLAIVCSSELTWCREHGLPSSILGHPCGREWAQRLSRSMGGVARQAIREQMSGWTSGIALALDCFYEPSVPRARLQPALLRCLRCASALAILRDEICDSQDWLVTMCSGMQEIVQSLEMEGFDVSVPHALRPGRLPLRHNWWYAQTRQGYLGCVTNIR